MRKGEGGREIKREEMRGTRKKGDSFLLGMP
jgi:hypothetical protein